LGHIVITSIQAPTPSVLGMLDKGSDHGLKLIAIGDRKTPTTSWPSNADFVSIEAQRNLGYALATRLPENHYARKNIGYLIAISQRSSLIYDTDDDNAPLDSWEARSMQTPARPCLQRGWVNAYRWFSDAHIWPRGLPLDQARHTKAAALGDLTQVAAPIQQGLANGSPDVDAVWHLVMDQEITFRPGDSVSLPAGTWSPFNSQSTWWFPQAYPLLYLPSFVSFRMTDIWRSFIAQRCLWALGQQIVFHGPEVFQDRNPHNLLRDFEQEVPGYLNNDRIRDVLERLQLAPGPAEVAGNLHRCYEALIQSGLIASDEMKLVECWLADLQRQAEGTAAIRRC
jgi:STELLO glycosyltransferases